MGSSTVAESTNPSNVLGVDGSHVTSPISARQRSMSRKAPGFVHSSDNGSSSYSSGSCSSNSSSAGSNTGRPSIGEIRDWSALDQKLVEEGVPGIMIEKPRRMSERGKEGGRRKGESTSECGGPEKKNMLGEWSATALCGNDLLSSCLYTIGLVTQKAGKAAPLSFIFVSLVLYLIKNVYAMAVLSFPQNGGSYNVLAHVAPRPLAVLAATLSIISYIATCVVSAVSACDYLSKVIDMNSPVLASVLLLLFFAALVLTGLKESSSIALGIFLVHGITLLVLAVSCFAVATSQGFSVLWLNIDQPYPKITMAGSEMSSSLGIALFLGFSSAMLGVSGYETTAQCIEHLHSETFIKCLWNLWVGVTVINPLLSFLAISILPIPEINANSDTVLSRMAMVSGEWIFGEGSSMAQLFTDWMSLEAFCVLSGVFSPSILSLPLSTLLPLSAVLTAFVGLDGLVFQMSLDKCLPGVFLRKNGWRGTNHYIIFTFLLLCIALIVAMDGKVTELAGMYSMAFLGVLATFIMGSMLLKNSPKHIPLLIAKGLTVKWWTLCLSLALICISLLGNLLGSSSVIISFLSYFLPIYGICLICLYADKARLVCCPGSMTATRLCQILVKSDPKAISPRERVRITLKDIALGTLDRDDTSSPSSSSSSSTSLSSASSSTSPRYKSDGISIA